MQTKRTLKIYFDLASDKKAVVTIPYCKTVAELKNEANGTEAVVTAMLEYFEFSPLSVEGISVTTTETEEIA